MYHEKQQRELCALHALNNLFQDKSSFSKSQLDHICQSLSPNDYINPHRSLLGLGNYDVNVIIAALHMKDCEAVWFDKRKDPSRIDTSKIVGFILNVPTTYKVGFVRLPIQRRHWIAIRQINEEYWNLDSKLDVPQCLGDESSMLEYLREQLNSNDKELFIVCTNEVDKTQQWLLPDDHRKKNSVE
ncbi:josephin-like protein [Anopheles cruzii]|uniref:josephin-like protein n=1 Tax=Anopheles cruzii TaxID=68878 RepID=UPI0022EC4FEE|nr:josephin-like protein [Anopheles cruzii]